MKKKYIFTRTLLKISDEVERLSSFMEREKTRLEDENAQFKKRIYNLEEKLKENSLKLEDVYEKSVRLGRSNTERAQEANRIKELLESGSVVGGGKVSIFQRKHDANINLHHDIKFSNCSIQYAI